MRVDTVKVETDVSIDNEEDVIGMETDAVCEPQESEPENCVDLVEGETGSCSEACVTCDGDGTEAVCIKVEDAIDIKDEIPETVSFPPIKTEHEVHLSKVLNYVRFLSATLLDLLRIEQLLAVRVPEL